MTKLKICGYLLMGFGLGIALSGALSFNMFRFAANKGLQKGLQTGIHAGRCQGIHLTLAAIYGDFGSQLEPPQSELISCSATEWEIPHLKQAPTLKAEEQ